MSSLYRTSQSAKFEASQRSLVMNEVTLVTSRKMGLSRPEIECVSDDV